MPKKDYKKKITIEKLAQMVARGFDNTATKEDVAEIKEDLNKLSGKVTSLQNRLDVHAGLDRHVEKLDKRLTRVEEKIEA